MYEVIEPFTIGHAFLYEHKKSLHRGLRLAVDIVSVIYADGVPCDATPWKFGRVPRLDPSSDMKRIYILQHVRLRACIR